MMMGHIEIWESSSHSSTISRARTLHLLRGVPIATLDYRRVYPEILFTILLVELYYTEISWTISGCTTLRSTWQGYEWDLICNPINGDTFQSLRLILAVARWLHLLKRSIDRFEFMDYQNVDIHFQSTSPYILSWSTYTYTSARHEVFPKSIEKIHISHGSLRVCSGFQSFGWGIWVCSKQGICLTFWYLAKETPHPELIYFPLPSLTFRGQIVPHTHTQLAAHRVEKDGVVLIKQGADEDRMLLVGANWNTWQGSHQQWWILYTCPKVLRPRTPEDPPCDTSFLFPWGKIQGRSNQGLQISIQYTSCISTF